MLETNRGEARLSDKFLGKLTKIRTLLPVIQSSLTNWAVAERTLP